MKPPYDWRDYARRDEKAQFNAHERSIAAWQKRIAMAEREKQRIRDRCRKRAKARD